MNQKTTTGKTPFQKFQALAKGLMQVPKSELDRKIKEHMEAKKKHDERRKKSI
jgi:hypothetical protein